MMDRRAAVRRIIALMRKEALQLLRDRATLGMLLGIPLLQIVVFGFAIELTPRSLDVTLVSSPADAPSTQRSFRQLSASLRMHTAPSLEIARRSMARGETAVIIDTRVRPVMAYIDASNPVVSQYAQARIEHFVSDMNAPIDPEAPAAFEIHIERLYNPEASTRPFLLTGLLGAIPTMSLVMMAALSVARERERGTLEVLRASPARFHEVACGKLAPYLVLGMAQSLLILIVMRTFFHITIAGSVTSLLAALTIFSAANLMLGLLFSCLARQQMQAMQMTFFFFLPSSLLSGFMFPFQAMPAWAQWIGETLPMTHYLRITRSMILRGVDSGYVGSESVPIVLFAGAVAAASHWVWRKRIA